MSDFSVNVINWYYVLSSPFFTRDKPAFILFTIHLPTANSIAQITAKIRAKMPK